MRGIAVGVDAGGTSTLASYSRDGIFCESAAGEAASATAIGAEAAAARIAEVIATLVKNEAPAGIYVGAAGAGRPDVAQSLQAALQARFAKAQVRVSDDAHIALRAGVPSGPGIVLIAGTGSIAYAENERNEAFRAGGYGFLLGDDGSGFALGLAASKHLTRVYDGRVPPDELSAEVQRRLGVSERFELLAKVYGSKTPVPLLASLAHPVLELANAGVRSAQKLAQAAALELAELVRVVVKNARLAETSCPLVLAGGLLRENSMLSFLLETRLQADYPCAEIQKRPPEPHRGALAAAEALIDR